MNQATDILIQYLLQSEKGFSLMKEYHSAESQLAKRKDELDESFEFNKKQIEQLVLIDKWLTEKLLHAWEYAKTLALFAAQSNQTFLSDYEIEFEIRCYSTEKYKSEALLAGVPVLELRHALVFNKNKCTEAQYAWYFETNHNLLPKTHPLGSYKLSWLMHQFYEHTYLAWQDIIDIEMLNIDVIFTAQNCSLKPEIV